jgi:hypothetical protein
LVNYLSQVLDDESLKEKKEEEMEEQRIEKRGLAASSYEVGDWVENVEKSFLDSEKGGFISLAEYDNCR